MNKEQVTRQSIRCERLDDILVVDLDRPPANALNRPMIEELHSAVDEVIREDAVRGLVLASSVPGVFCNGFDIREVTRYDRETLLLFFSRFIDLYESLYLLPKPIVAAISGQAGSWGAILALACDLRIFGNEGCKFLINEVNLGIPLPPGLVRLLVGTVGPGTARELLLTGTGIAPERALTLGLAHEIVDQASVTSRAISECSALARKPAKAFAALKRSLRVLTGPPGDGDDRDALPEIIEHWFSEETEARKQALL